MNIFQEAISEKVWDSKYRYRKQSIIIDKTIEDTWARIAKAVAYAELPKNAARWEKEFYAVLADFRFLPGGRIIAGAGTAHSVTLFNCFVMPILEDSLPGIFDSLKQAALTLQQGGGVGYDFSTLRPHGNPVLHTGSIASGPISFMRIWNAMCATMESTGARRGAMMGILRCDHPDIEEFILAKSDPLELRHFNVSVLVSDAFMQAVRADRDWELVFPVYGDDLADTVMRHWSGSAEPVPCRVAKVVRARELWEKIMKAAYSYAEPGVLFEDTINRQNNLWYREWISATNPCGEIPLPIYGACNLGAINLTQFVKNPYESSAAIDWQGIQKTAAVATRFLDNVIDISRFPLKEQKEEIRLTRRIGLGFTGLADMLVLLNIRYGSDAAIQLAAKLMQTISEATWQTSIDLAQERGVFPAFHGKKYRQGHFIEKMGIEVHNQIEKFGIRNSHHNTIAPTGTISLLANNVSNGIEPVFSAAYERAMRGPDGVAMKFSVLDYALRLWNKMNKAEKLPPAWVDTHDLTPEQHLKMQAAVQPYVDNAISKTINLPADFPFEKLQAVYSQAYELGLKGCTVFRPNPVTGSVLTETKSDDDVDRCCQY